MSAHNGTPQSSPAWVAAGITGAALLLLVVKVLVQAVVPDLKLDDLVSVGLLIVAALPWVAQLLTSAKLPGGLELVFREIKEAQAKQAIEISHQKVEFDKGLDRILNVIKNLVSDEDEEVLRRLASTEKMLHTHDSDVSEQVMRARLRRLRTLGLIDVKRSIHRIIDEKNVNKDIKADIAVSEEGQKFLKADEDQ
jgi:hypothetical protein